MDKRQNLFVFDNGEEMSDFVIEKWAQIAGKAIQEKGNFTAALSGGKTPIVLYQKLGSVSGGLPWDKTHLFLVDERFVPFDHEDSNYRMLQETLLSKIEIPKKNIHPVPVEESTPEISAGKYEEEMRRFFRLSQGQFPQFDLVLLGIGEDGHTASLFPGTPALKENSRLAVAVIPADAKHRRITLTLPVLNQGRNVIFLVSGKNKAPVLERVIKRDASLPASLVNPENGNLLFVTDAEAGSALSP